MALLLPAAAGASEVFVVAFWRKRDTALHLLQAPWLSPTAVRPGYGMTFALPSGWKARIYKRLGGPPIAKAASFNLPRGDDDAGTDAQKAMRSGDVLLILFRLSSGGSAPESARYPTVSHVTIRRRDFKALWKGVPTARHAFAQRTFRFQGDLFDIWAQFGTQPACHRAVLDANTVLHSLK